MVFFSICIGEGIINRYALVYCEIAIEFKGKKLSDDSPEPYLLIAY